MNVIDGRQIKYKTAIDISVSIVCWLLMLAFIFQLVCLFFSTNIASYIGDLTFIYIPPERALGTTIVCVFVSMSIILLTSFWVQYNKKKYRSLNRRKAPESVSNYEIAQYFNLRMSFILDMQTKRIIELDGTIL